MNQSQFSFIQKVSILVSNFGFSRDVANYIGCQFALESDFGKSNLAVSHCNYCGMKFPLVRISLANRISELNRFASYNDLLQCVTDYMLCLNYHQPSSKIRDSILEFKQFINGWYCPEKSYIDKINSIYVQFQNQLKNGN